MIVNNLNYINEARSVNLGDGKSAYQYNGKYYLKSGNTKKEISADQYNKLASKDKSSSKNSSNLITDKPSYKDPYYFVNADGEVVSGNWSGHPYDNMRLHNSNMFSSDKISQKDKDRISKLYKEGTLY